MCWCNPNRRTPQCGNVACVPPLRSGMSNETLHVPELSRTKRYLDTSYEADIEVYEDSVIITRYGANAKGNDVGHSESMVFDKVKFRKFLLDLWED